MDIFPKQFRIRHAIYGLVGLMMIGCTADYYAWKARKTVAMEVVSDLGGKAFGLGGWPLRQEFNIKFTRPLTPEELDRLTVLNLLPPRGIVAVAFDCEITPQQLKIAKGKLSECLVFQPKDVQPNVEACDAEEHSSPEAAQAEST